LSSIHGSSAIGIDRTCIGGGCYAPCAPSREQLVSARAGNAPSRAFSRLPADACFPATAHPLPSPR